MIQLTLWSIAPLLAALTAAGVYARLSRRARIPGVKPLLALLAAVLFWSGCQFLETLFTGLGPKLMLARLAAVAILLVPLTWFLFAICYTSRRMRPSRTLVNLLAVVPMVTICLLMTNDAHHLIWSSAELVETNGYVGLVLEYGPWLPVQSVYSFGLVVVGATILAYVLWSTKGELKPVAGVMAGPLIGCAAALVDLSAWQPLASFRFTTLGFAASALILDATVLRYGVLDNIPVLRDRVLEQLTEGVMVVTDDGTIVDVNQSALDVLGITRGRLTGTGVEDHLPELSLATLSAGDADGVEVRRGDRCYDVACARLDPDSLSSDLVLTFRDVTVRGNALLALRQAQQELERLAHTDSLTGIYNRRLFMARLDDEVQRLRRHDGQLSVLILDLDHFKAVNDRYGHAAGDRVLKAVAETAAEVKRGSDVLARIGGEEFALLLPTTDGAGAMELAGRLGAAIAAIDTRELVGAELQITASMGLATVTGHGDPAGILKTADDALYRAKHGGRNRVCADEERM